MVYTVISDSTNKVNAGLSKLIADGWEPVLKSTASWGLMSDGLVRPPMLMTVLLRRRNSSE